MQYSMAPIYSLFFLIVRAGKFLGGRCRGNGVIALLIFMPGLAPAQTSWGGAVLEWETTIGAKGLSVDRLGQVYILTPDQQLVRFGADGVPKGVFAQPALGRLSGIDVSDPLSPLLWYPDFQAVVLLDRTMGLLATLYLPSEVFAYPTLVARGRDNRIWVFDKFHNRLMSIDAQGRLLGQSQELSLGAQGPKDPQLLVGDEEGFFLCDSLQGLWRFDRLGQFQYFVPEKNIQAVLPLSGNRAILRSGDGFLLLDIGRLPTPVDFPFAAVFLSLQGDVMATWGGGVLRYYRK
jgi:hypothetical protein